MYKYLVIFILLAGCDIFDTCERGDFEICYCLYDDYTNFCGEDGYWPDCQCYDNGDNDPNSTDDPDFNGSTEEHIYDSLLEYFPNCAATYQNDCLSNEIKVPCTNLCWRICPVGTDYNGTECVGYASYSSYQTMKDSCTTLHNNYRFPTVNEISYLLNNCFPETFNKEITNYCSPYDSSAIRFIVGNKNNISFWTGELEYCTDHYDQYDKNCAWMTRLYVGGMIPTDFNWLLGNGTAGSALSAAFCIREQ